MEVFVEQIDLTGDQNDGRSMDLNKLNKTIEKVTDLFERFEFGEANRHLITLSGMNFCDWYSKS